MERACCWGERGGEERGKGRREKKKGKERRKKKKKKKNTNAKNFDRLMSGTIFTNKDRVVSENVENLKREKDK